MVTIISNFTHIMFIFDFRNKLNAVSCFNNENLYIVQGVSEKLKPFYNLIIWAILIQMISDFNCICRNNLQFYVFSDIEMPFTWKEEMFKYEI